MCDNDQEKWYVIGSQVFLPFMIAGFGMVAAGLVLERVKVFIYMVEWSCDTKYKMNLCILEVFRPIQRMPNYGFVTTLSRMQYGLVILRCAEY